MYLSGRVPVTVLSSLHGVMRVLVICMTFWQVRKIMQQEVPCGQARLTQSQ